MLRSLVLLPLLYSSLAHSFLDEEIRTCGEVDQRQSYKNQRIARTRGNDFSQSGCTATLISENCFISAGHCKDYFRYVEFNVPRIGGWEPVHPGAGNVYLIDQKSVVTHDGGVGDDWAVFKVERDILTNKFPGEKYGFYKVSLSVPKSGEKISIAGYGADWREDMRRNYTLQIASGVVEKVTHDNYGMRLKIPRITYRIDTAGGSSGSAVIRKRDNSIVGIHTNGGCDRLNPNSGSVIAKNPAFIKAIRQCLK